MVSVSPSPPHSSFYARNPLLPVVSQVSVLFFKAKIKRENKKENKSRTLLLNAHVLRDPVLKLS